MLINRSFHNEYAGITEFVKEIFQIIVMNLGSIYPLKVVAWVDDWMNEWMINEWGWLNEWMNDKWMNEWINE